MCRQFTSRTNFVWLTNSGTVVKKAGPDFFRGGIRFSPREQLIREASYLNLLESPHFPKVLSVKLDELELTYCGDPLEAQPIPADWQSQVREIANLLRDQNIVHRDIKPANILVKDGKLCLIDFGLAFRGIREFWISPREISFNTNPIYLYSNLRALTKVLYDKSSQVS
jgi:predicted Ser/Thr protein kinase